MQSTSQSTLGCYLVSGLKGCSIAQLLQKMHHCRGLVYLANNAQPVVAFCPSYYVLAQTSELQFFKQNTWNCYFCNNDLTENLTKYFPVNSQNAQFEPDVASTATNATDGFTGGYIGFVSYDYAAKQLLEVTFAAQPALYLGYYPHYLKQKNNGEWYFYSTQNDALVVLNQLHKLLHSEPAKITFKRDQPVQTVWHKAQYYTAFQKVQDYITAGDCYQINLTQAFKGKAQGSLLACADALWQLTQAPYAGYLKLDDFELLSCSPELFLEFSAQRQLKTRPIKGTRPRAQDAKQDAQSAQDLLDSSKDQAENVMIVDLLRNDLSVYAEIGSVKTPKLFEIESFQQVHHLVSEVVATLKPHIHPLDVLMHALPGGSITGAPKKRAMQIIQELEVAPRGAYCGSLGYFNMDGTGCWNILIRTVQKMQDDVSVWAGGGITIASDADAEYQECLDKVSAMVALLNQWPASALEKTSTN